MRVCAGHTPDVRMTTEYEREVHVHIAIDNYVNIVTKTDTFLSMTTNKIPIIPEPNVNLNVNGGGLVCVLLRGERAASRKHISHGFLEL